MGIGIEEHLHAFWRSYDAIPSLLLLRLYACVSPWTSSLPICSFIRTCCILYLMILLYSHSLLNIAYTVSRYILGNFLQTQCLIWVLHREMRGLSFCQVNEMHSNSNACYSESSHLSVLAALYRVCSISNRWPQRETALRFPCHSVND
jgi:hypothetical protein